MRSAVLVAALVSALVAAALGLDIISAGDSLAEQHTYAVGWGFWGLALFIVSFLVPDR